MSRAHLGTARTAVHMWLQCSCVGALAGLLSGLFGVGGGVLIVPGLVFVMSMPQRRAHGTSLAAIVPVAAAGVLGYLISDEVDFAAVSLVAPGAMAGALAGTNVLHRLSPGALRVAFAGLLVAAAIRMLIEPGIAEGRAPLTLALAVGLVTIGVLSGVLAGLFGVGGGILIVPAMVVLFGMPDALAKGTSLLVILPTAVLATWRNVRYENADLPVAMVVGASGVLTAFLGARLSVGLSSELARRLFAVLLTVIALQLVLVQVRQSFARARAKEKT